MPFCRRGSSWASMSGLTNRKELSAAKPQPKGRRDFTAETRTSQSSESILTKKLFTLRPPRLRGESSDNLRTPRKLSRIAIQRSQRKTLWLKNYENLTAENLARRSRNPREEEISPQRHGVRRVRSLS